MVTGNKKGQDQGNLILFFRIAFAKASAVDVEPTGIEPVSKV
jgi:hypothetical protein